MKNKQILLVAILVLLVGGGAFLTGYKVGEVKSRVLGNNRMENFTGRGQGMGLRDGSGTGTGKNMTVNRPVNGEIVAIDDKSITVKMADGSSKIVILGETKVSRSTEIKVADLKVGQTVGVFGTTNTDGSVSALNIEIDPKNWGQIIK